MRAMLILLLALVAGPVLAQQVMPRIVDDSIPRSLTGQPGDAARGRAIVANRSVGLCLLCQALAETVWRFSLRHYTSASS